MIGQRVGRLRIDLADDMAGVTGIAKLILLATRIYVAGNDTVFFDDDDAAKGNTGYLAKVSGAIATESLGVCELHRQCGVVEERDANRLRAAGCKAGADVSQHR